MKNSNKMRKYPFLTAVVISIMCLTLIGFIGRNNIYSDYKCSFQKAPMLSAVFEGISAGEYPWKIVENNVSYAKQKPKKKSNKKPVNTKVIYNAGEVTKKPTEKNAAQEKQSGSIISGRNNSKTSNKKETLSNNSGIQKKNSVDINKGKQKSKKQKETIQKTDKQQDIQKNTDQKTDSQYTKQGNVKQQEDNSSEKKFVKVGKSYFNDALFIGDSRTVGLSEYSGWKNSTYYADVGLTIYDVFDKKIVKMNGKMITIDKALKRKHFKKVYIMLGINELGRGTTKTFISEYKKVVNRIKKLQPDAVIFVEGIMKVSKEKSDTDPIFNNKNITIKNDHLAKLADNKRIFYIDVNDAVTDKTGSIPAEYTFDNIHLKAAYYRLWTGFLLKHGIK